MTDVVEALGRALVQHGPASDRVYVMALGDADPAVALLDADALAKERGYGKVIAKVPTPIPVHLTGRGFRIEAQVPHLFGPSRNGAFLGKFLDSDRAEDHNEDEVARVLEATHRRGPKANADEDRRQVREAGAPDADALAECYGEVFDSYPFPIHDPTHIRAAMEEGTRFFIVEEDDQVVAASSMEHGGAPGAVEMTDFATLPPHRKQGLARALLAHMDRCAADAGVRVSFTIARALSFGMNITFRRRGYRFGGTLINNTQIAGSLESMNVWYRHPTIADVASPSQEGS